MRFLSQYCPQLVYAVTDPEGPAVELSEADRGPYAFSDCLYLQIGVERGDSAAAVLTPASKRIHRICRETGAQLVVLNAFAGLATTALRAAPEEALAVTHDLQRRLLERGYDTHLMPFGWMKSFPVQEVDAGLWQQRVEEIPPAAPSAASTRSLQTPDGLMVPAARGAA